MGKKATNLTIVLGLITITFAGYYIYSLNSMPTLDFETNEQNIQNMINETSFFINYTEILSRTKLDITFFEDESFSSLRNFTTPIKEQPIGRPDPFADMATNYNLSI
jgi:hypothetical protein